MDGAGKWPLPVPSCCFPGPGWKTVTLDFEGWISGIEEGTRPGVTTGRTSRNRIARRSFAVRAMDGIVEGWPEEIGWGGSAGANGTFPRKDTQDPGAVWPETVRSRLPSPSIVDTPLVSPQDQRTADTLPTPFLS